MSWEGVSPEVVAQIEDICTPRQTQALQLYVRGYKSRRMGRAMGISEPAARGLLDRAFLNLRRAGIFDHLIAG